MQKQFLIGVALLATPLYSHANNFIDLSLGLSKSNISESQLLSGVSSGSNLDTTGSIVSLTLGRQFYQKLSLSAQYTNFSETLGFNDDGLKQETYTYGFAASYLLYKTEQIGFEIGAGQERWHTKIRLPQFHWEGTTLVLRNTTYSDSGYSPYLFFNLSSRVNQNLEIGFKYEHHDNQGTIESIVDRDKLQVGDLAGALKIDSPVKFSVNLYAIFLRWHF